MTVIGRSGSAGPEWMTSREASALMGVSSATLRRWSDAGRIRTFTTLGGHRRFSRTAIADLLAADTAGGPSAAASRTSLQSVGELPTTADLEPGSRRAMQWHARRITTALLASAAAPTPDARTFVLCDAEASAVAWGAIAARSGLGLRDTVEGLLEVRSRVLRLLVDREEAAGHGEHALLAAIGAVTETFDRLVCGAMRAHESAARPR